MKTKNSITRPLMGFLLTALPYFAVSPSAKHDKYDVVAQLASPPLCLQDAALTPLAAASRFRPKMSRTGAILSARAV